MPHKGYAYTVRDRGDGSKPTEQDMFMCAHCRQGTALEPFQRAEDIGGFCRMCGGLICAKCCGLYVCDELERKLERAEKAQDIRRMFKTG